MRRKGWQGKTPGYSESQVAIAQAPGLDSQKPDRPSRDIWVKYTKPDSPPVTMHRLGTFLVVLVCFFPPCHAALAMLASSS